MPLALLVKEQGHVRSYDIRNLKTPLSSYPALTIYDRHFSKIMADETRLILSGAHNAFGPYVLQHMRGVFNMNRCNAVLRTCPYAPAAGALGKWAQYGKRYHTTRPCIIDFDVRGDTLAVAVSALGRLSTSGASYAYSHNTEQEFGQLFVYDLSRRENDRGESYKPMKVSHRSIISTIMKEEENARVKVRIEEAEKLKVEASRAKEKKIEFDYAKKKVEVEDRQRKKKDKRRAREGGKKSQGSERKAERDRSARNKI